MTPTIRCDHQRQSMLAKRFICGKAVDHMGYCMIGHDCRHLLASTSWPTPSRQPIRKLVDAKNPYAHWQLEDLEKAYKEKSWHDVRRWIDQMKSLAAITEGPA